MKFLSRTCVMLIACGVTGFVPLFGDWDSRRIDQMDAYIEKARIQGGIPGIAVALVSGTNVVFSKGYGEGITEETLFGIGSLSKSFTALAVMQLVEQGQLDLESPVKRYLPWFEMKGDRTDEITVAHLLYQRSGFSVYQGRLHLVSNELRNPAEVVRSYRNVRLKSLPGERFEYSNANYIVLGAIIEAVSGVTYSEYLKTKVMRPLGMAGSYGSAEEAAPGTVAGYRFWFGKPVRYSGIPAPVALAAAGGIVSSAKDLSKYAVALLNNGKFAGTTILSTNGMNRLFQRAEESKRNSYAMGWFVREAEAGEPKIINHGGDTAAFMSNLKLFPEMQMGLVMLINANSAKRPDLHTLPDGATDILFGKEPRVAPRDRMGAVLGPLFFLLPFAQVFGLIRTLRLLRKWRAIRVPVVSLRLWIFRWWLPLMGHTFLALFCFWLFPRAIDAHFSLLLTFIPDAGVQCGFIGVFAIVWGTIRSFLVAKELGRSRPVLDVQELVNA